jgi:hypothetical protein
VLVEELEQFAVSEEVGSVEACPPYKKGS